MQIGLLSVNVLYVAMWLCFNEAERGYFWTDALWLLLYSFVTKFCYESINDMNERGIRPDKQMDLLGVNIASQFAGCFSEWYRFWIMMIIPLYGLYYVVSMLSGFCCGGKAQPDQDDDPAEIKRKAKKERQDALKERRGGVKVQK